MKYCHKEAAVQINVFDRELWKRFWQIARLYWFSDERWRARGWLALLLLLLFSFTALNVVLNFVGRDFMTALAEKNLSEFRRTLLIYLGVFVVATPVSVFYSFVRKLLGLKWRLWLTEHFLARYFHGRAYYRINDDRLIDNPDQRISQDISSFTVTSLGFLSILFFSLVQLVSFIGILWSISVTLVVVLIAYAAFGTAVTFFFGRRLVHLNFQQLRREADLRYGLVRVRDNAEAIAFYRGEEREAQQVRRRLGEALGNLRLLIGWERNLEFFTKGYEYIILVLPVVVMAPMYFSGEIKFGVVTQAESAFVQVLSALSVIVSQFEQLGSFVAGISRLETFEKALAPPAPAPKGGEIKAEEGEELLLQDVTVATPDRNQILVKDLTVASPQARGLLIVGPSGAGKSSLLRALAGLWRTGKGRIVRPPLGEMLFLPQRPYMILGTLREQLLYPHLDREVTDEELQEVLRRVNLEDLPRRVGGFDAVLDWGQVLSLGEQQRVAFARLLLARPRFAFLDEATSALDAENEALLYRELQKTGAAYLSVGHRPSLRAFHGQVLELKGNGNWELRAAA